MSTFSEQGRDLSGWRQLLDLAESLLAKPENERLRASIGYERQMPSTSPFGRGTVDILAGTAVTWANAAEDDLDHHWEVRRIERIAPSWRTLLPSTIDFEGWADAQCSIELSRGQVIGHASREDGEKMDSLIEIIHSLEQGVWIPRVEISWTYDGSDSDVAAMEDQDVIEEVETRGWRLHGVAPLGYKIENGNFVVIVPVTALAMIDKESTACTV